MRQDLHDKILKLEIVDKRANEAYWQDMLRVRDVRHKLRQKEYADVNRNAGRLDVEAKNFPFAETTASWEQN